VFEEMEARAHEALDADGFGRDDRTVERLADVRYGGQVKALTLTVDASRSLAAEWAAVRERFLTEYERRFQYVTDEIPLEISALRVRASGHMPAPEHPRAERGQGEPPVRDRRAVWFDGAPCDTAVLDRDALRAGHRFAGPALVEQLDTTTVVPPGVACVVDDRGNLIIDCRSAAAG
jgi:N-methylhydantoinase A